MQIYHPSANITHRPKIERVQPPGIIVGLLGVVLMAIVFNLFPHKIGVVISDVDPSTFVPMLGPGFAGYLPWLNLYWGSVFVLGVILLVRGRWDPLTRWADLGLTFFAAWILFQMIFGDSTFGLDPRWLAQSDLSPDSITALNSTIIPLMSMLFRFVLAVAFFGTMWAIYRKLKQLLSLEQTSAHTQHA